MKKPSDEVKLAYLVGLCAGVAADRRLIPRAEQKRLRQNAGIAAECVFGDGAFNPLQVADALSHVDELLQRAEELKEDWQP